jgi:hypothetical protein
LFSFVTPKIAHQSSLVHVLQRSGFFNGGFKSKDLNSEEFVNIFSGETILPDANLMQWVMLDISL